MTLIMCMLDSCTCIGLVLDEASFNALLVLIMNNWSFMSVQLSVVVLDGMTCSGSDPRGFVLIELNLK